MHLKNLKNRVRKPSLWKVVSGCAEQDLNKISSEFCAELEPGDIVLLEGPLGAGKTTFAKILLKQLGVKVPPEGSPTFPIAYEYSGAIESKFQKIIHIDFYRLNSEREIDEIGIPEYFSDNNTLVIAEWLSFFPDYKKCIVEDGIFKGKIWQILIDFSTETLASKNVEDFLNLKRILSIYFLED